MATPVHACPGCGKHRIPNRLLACQPCWTRLPGDLRRPLQTVTRGTAEHRDALTAALTWYRNHPKETKP